MNTTAHLPRPRILLLALATMFVLAANAFADGVFVAPKFVWDKHKDINEPTQKAILVYDAGQEDMILQVKYEGPLEQFGWLIPVPSLPTVKNGSMKCFYELSQYTQQHFPGEAPPPGKGREDFALASLSAGAAPEPPVKVVEIKTVGAYEIAVLSTRDSSALTQWLQTNQFYFPPDKTDVIDSYVKQKWYFVAVKINLGHSIFTSKTSTASQLASGELNPLQITFASDQCVFPLKISSVNGRPSEVQVYILSPEPLLEREMLEKKLPLIYSNDLAEANQDAQRYKTMMNRMRQSPPSRNLYAQSFSMDEAKIKRIAETPVLSPNDLLPYAKLTQADLPDCTIWIPRLAAKSWWLAKQTWTFKPDEMHDLVFEPAIPYFGGALGSTYGYFAAASLASFGSDAVPALVAAFQNTNLVVRLNAIHVTTPFRYDPQTPVQDPGLSVAAVPLLNDGNPEVRSSAAIIMGMNWNPLFAAPLVNTLTDADTEARSFAESDLEHHPSDITNFIPRFQALLKDPNPDARALSVELLHHLNVPMSKDNLLCAFQGTGTGLRVVNDAYENFVKLTGRYPSDTEVGPLLQNPTPYMRKAGLWFLYQNADQQAVTLALPLLHDPDPSVRARAAAILRALTGQHFTDQQSAEWTNWWTQNKTNSILNLHGEDLRFQRYHPWANPAEEPPE